MTTIDAESTDGPDRSCPKCKKGTREDVPETEIWHCDACGATGDYSTGEIVDPTADPDPVATAAVQPDEVLNAGDVPRNVLPVPAEPDKAGLVSGLSIAPSPDEWERMTAMAVVMSASNIVPAALRGKPNDVFVILWTGRDLGIPVTTALRSVHVIEGTPSLSPKLRIARVHMLGLGDVVPDPMQEADPRLACIALALDNAKCNVCKGAQFLGLDEETMKPIPCEACRTTGHRIKGKYEYTWAMAKAAGALSQTDDCTPDDHKCKSSNNGKTTWRCKQNWRTYPDRMLWWRAGGYIVDTVFPEAGMGLYSPDELGAVTDEDGTMINVDTVELPSGYEGSRRGGRSAASVEPADPAEVEALGKRIQALPEAQKASLKLRWDEKGHEGRINTLATLLSTQLPIAKALVNGAEADAKASGWKPPDPAATDDTASPPPVAQEGTEAPAGTVDAPQAPTEPQSAPQSDEDRLAAQRGKAEGIVTEAIIDRARATVQAMTSREIGDNLRERGFSTGGNAEHRTNTLGRAIAKELAAADHAEANPPAEPTEALS